jgi:hypothetical protein
MINPVDQSGGFGGFRGCVLARAANIFRSIYHNLSRVKSGGGTAYLFPVAGRIACKDASLFDAFSGPWTSSSTFYKLREIERTRFADGGN